MNKSILVSIILGAIVGGYHCAIVEPRIPPNIIKVFNYQGNLPPIKDDRTGEIIKDDTNVHTNSTSEAEKLCWDLIVDQSGKLPICRFEKLTSDFFWLHN